MGHVRGDGVGKQYGNTTFCPFNNGNSCSKSCALYDANRYPVCGMAPHKDKPEVNVECKTDLTKVVASLDEVALQVMELIAIMKGSPVEDVAPDPPREAKSKVEVAAEWLSQCTPFDIANQTSGKVHEGFTAWCNRHGYSERYTQKGLTEFIVNKTGAVAVPGHGKGNTRFETTPEFLGWSQKRMSDG